MEEKQIKILFLLPTLIGIALIIVSIVSGVTGVMYAGIAVLFGGNFLMAVGTFIYAMRGIKKNNESNEDKRPKTKEEKMLTRKTGAAACGVIAAVVGFPFAGMVLMSLDNIPAGVAVFMCGPVAIGILLLVSRVQAKKEKTEYEETGYRKFVREEKFGTVFMCVPISGSKRYYLVRVECDGARISARSETPFEKGDRVKVLIYDDASRTEAVPADDKPAPEKRTIIPGKGYSYAEDVIRRYEAENGDKDEDADDDYDENTDKDYDYDDENYDDIDDEDYEDEDDDYDDDYAEDYDDYDEGESEEEENADEEHDEDAVDDYDEDGDEEPVPIAPLSITTTEPERERPNLTPPAPTDELAPVVPEPPVEVKPIAPITPIERKTVGAAKSTREKPAPSDPPADRPTDKKPTVGYKGIKKK